MFFVEQPSHIETVVKLVRKTPDAYIDLKVDMDELDLTASEAKATYQEIKDYIVKKHGVKVSSLYIAQIKQKHGIIERDCYARMVKICARISGWDIGCSVYYIRSL